MNSLIKTLIWIILLAIAMGFMESAVVIYLRELYYKNGFEFPLKGIPTSIARVEFFREIATIIMLIGAGIIAGKTKLQRFAYFALAFAIWDIFYYVFLYVCLGWPQSLSTWDILFLIPTPWVGPVWAPCLLSLLMIVGSVFTIIQTEKNKHYKIQIGLWWLLITGTLICIFSFMLDYLCYTIEKSSIWTVTSKNHLFSELSTYTPQHFNSLIFFMGFLLMLSSVYISIHKSVKIK